MTVSTGKGTGEITAWVQDGKVNIGLSANNLLPDALKGAGEWGRRKPFTELRVMWPQLPTVAQIAVLKDSPIKSVFVIKGVVGDSISLETIFRGIGWFLVVEFVTVFLLILFPQISLFLPNLSLGR